MTRDEIAALRELAETRTPLQRHFGRMNAAAALPRLLEERERLLEALGGLCLIHWRDDGKENCWCDTDGMPEKLPEPDEAGMLYWHEEQCNTARDAIAFAEAPSATAPAGKEEK